MKYVPSTLASKSCCIACGETLGHDDRNAIMIHMMKQKLQVPVSKCGPCLSVGNLDGPQLQAVNAPNP